MDSPVTDVAIPSTPESTRPWTSACCASASNPSGPTTWTSTPSSAPACLAASAICWMNGFPMTWMTTPILIGSSWACAVGPATAANVERGRP